MKTTHDLTLVSEVLLEESDSFDHWNDDGGAELDRPAASVPVPRR